jgi:hypothetical protein
MSDHQNIDQHSDQHNDQHNDQHSSGVTAPLYRLAHGRTGDKGNRSNISVIAYHKDLYPLLASLLTEDVVKNVFAERRPQAVTRYLLPKLGAINFVLDGVLDGGVNDSLNLDSHGKALAFLLLQTPVAVPARLRPLLVGAEYGTE